MKWKDSGELVNQEETDREEEFFDEEQYSPWADRKGEKRRGKLNRIQVLFVLLAVAIAALCVVLIMLLMNGNGGDASSRKLASLNERLIRLEERLDKYEAIDEKVTRIWEQAKSFEKFKDRFERSEASMSLRMDHLTMSLETLQKQLNETQAAAADLAAPTSNEPQKALYHKVQKGETLYSISKKYGVAMDQLRKLNQMKPNSVNVQVGQTLLIRAASE